MAKKRGKKFHQFSRLPPELRTRIWEMTEAEPRVVDVSTRPPDRIQGRYQYVKSSTRPPAVLHACSEARRCALARSLYVKAFTDGFQPRYTWVNFEKDMIAVEPMFFDPIMSEKTLIQRLRMTGHMDDEVFYHKSYHQMREFVNIKEVHVICADDILSWRQAVDELYFGTYNVKFFHKTPEGRMLDWEGMKATFPSTWT